MRTLLDTGRGVADDVLKLLAQLVDDLLHTFLGQRVLVAGLAGGQDVEVFQAFVLDQGLVEGGIAVDDVDEVIHHAALATHDQVEVAQAHVEVDEYGLVAAQCQSCAQGGGGGGLADTTLT